MPDHCQECFWNDQCSFETEEDLEEAENCDGWMETVAA